MTRLLIQNLHVVIEDEVAFLVKLEEFLRAEAGDSWFFKFKADDSDEEVKEEEVIP